MLLPLMSALLNQIRNEPLRPQFHFTAPSGWLNDPNGLAFQDGQYHLFYQHNPKGTGWGNMTWGHAVSRDLIHWQDLPNAIEPDEFGTIFSGSAVIDKDNVSGLGTAKHPPLLCFYTAAGGTNDMSKGKPFCQCLAWSTDGKTFTKFAGNPIVAHIEAENRDPKVVWDGEHKQWLMALYLANSKYTLLRSANLKDWTRLSDIKMPGTDECPDFFRLPVDGDKSKTKWIFTGANGRYMVGSFDGQAFHAEGPPLDSNFGNTGYAAQTYSNAPNGRVIQIAWLNNSNFPNCSWNQQMGFPNELKLRSTPSGPRLALTPVPKIRIITAGEVAENEGSYEVPSGLLDFNGAWSVPSKGVLSIDVNGVKVSLDAEAGRLSALGKEANVDLSSGKFNIRVLADRTSVEIYAQDGLVWMPLFALPKEGSGRGVRITYTGDWPGHVKVQELSSVWEASRR